MIVLVSLITLLRGFPRGEEKTAWYNLLAHASNYPNLGNSDTRVYFQCTSIVVFRCMSVYLQVWGLVSEEVRHV